MRAEMKRHLTSLQLKVVYECGLHALKPGDALPSERMLAEASGLGRSPVRGMLAVLQSEGIVKRSLRGWILAKCIPELPPAKEGSKRQIAKAFLLAELGSGGLNPGDQLSELALAKKIGVATISMREALLEMMPLGLLTKTERQKWEVAAFSKERIAELSEFREMVEDFCLKKLLTRGLSDERRKAFELVRAKSRLVLRNRQTTIPEILTTDLAFHRLLIEAAGNSLLKERAGFIYIIIEFQLLSTFYSVEKGKLGIGQHLKIIDAILREDLLSARRFLLEHLRTSEQVLCDIGSQCR